MFVYNSRVDKKKGTTNRRENKKKVNISRKICVLEKSEGDQVWSLFEIHMGMERFYATLFRIAVLTCMLAVVITVPYRQGDSTSSIRQTYGTAQGRILTVRSRAVAVYGTVDSPS